MKQSEYRGTVTATAAAATVAAFEVAAATAVAGIGRFATGVVVVLVDGK
jgi:hypothetical protein